MKKFVIANERTSKKCAPQERSERGNLSGGDAVLETGIASGFALAMTVVLSLRATGGSVAI